MIKNQQPKGFSLIELMVVIAIIGLLAAIAIPSYKNYVRRSQYVEMFPILENFKTQILEYYNSNGAFPPSVSNCPKGTYCTFNQTNGGTANTTFTHNNTAYGSNGSPVMYVWVVTVDGNGFADGNTFGLLFTTDSSQTKVTPYCGCWNIGYCAKILSYLPSSCNRTDLSTL
ncbi:MAG: type 4 fimbrial biosynthesis protein [Francisellaceae bacterium]|nr:type 4 fimbrial biosynthesis protein [Francisellaceae bacterium]